MKQTNFLHDLQGSRLVCWFSCGATSAVACKIAITENQGKLPVVVAYCDVGNEHPDNERFLSECAKWLGIEIVKLKNPKYKDVDDVIETKRYLNGPRGARCTKELKIAVRLAFQRVETDTQVFGFDAGEVDRAFDFRESYPDVNLYTPLIKRGLTKADCLAMLKEVGIKLPKMYEMGYRNNNCIGCVKGGAGYWNKIRTDFPAVFEQRAKQERAIGHSCIKGTFLDELKPTAGRYSAEPDISCEGLCMNVKQEMESCES